jgi:hypothetical protein
MNWHNETAHIFLMAIAFSQHFWASFFMQVWKYLLNMTLSSWTVHHPEKEFK